MNQKSIREEDIAHSLFVMNMEEEIRQTFRNYHSGLFRPQQSNKQRELLDLRAPFAYYD